MFEGFLEYVAIGCVIAALGYLLPSVKEILDSKPPEQVSAIAIVFVIAYPIWIVYGVLTVLVQRTRNK